MKNFVRLVLAAAVALSACGGNEPAREPDNLTGTVLVKADSTHQDVLATGRAQGKLGVGLPCSGDTFGFDDVTGGAKVVVKDGSGDTIATTSLSTGNLTEDACSFRFVVNDLAESDSYEFSVASQKGPTLSRQDIEDDSFAVELTIGG